MLGIRILDNTLSRYLTCLAGWSGKAWRTTITEPCGVKENDLPSQKVAEYCKEWDDVAQMSSGQSLQGLWVTIKVRILFYMQREGTEEF
jgi:hypothetical protein